MCIVCDKTQTVFDATQQLMIGIAKNAQGDGYIMLLTQEREKTQSVNVLIRYCPWCGNDIAEARKQYNALTNA